MTPDWAPAFEAVPRSRFLPDLMWPHDMATGRNAAVDRDHDPEAWQRYADSDDPIVTQWDDGEHIGPEPGRSFSSSSSMPSLVFSMLADLEVRPGQRALEIGTGTGWNAALLAHRLGAANVVSVEVDATVAAQARESLGRFGLPVEVVRGDGFLGYAQQAPYDRIIATCGLRKIPFAWVEQSTPGAVILVPWGTYYGPGEATARLVVADDRRSASGPFTRPVAFMRMRSQRFVRPRHDEYVPTGAMDAADISFTSITEEDLCGTGDFDPVGFVLGLCVPDVAHTADLKRDGKRAVWFYGLSDRSWAVAVFRDDRTKAKVYQSGSRRLWDEVEAAHRWWTEQGRPDFSRFGLTVDERGERPWLGSPDNPVRTAGLRR
ncbi:methyltransferase domain-containing protein [Streptomyces sp. AV19]|uniref:methyltransferase domain-containing protein n=1 Tax=Streptomyces sp. AV19 TaxID=2793068 RepID=UPI0018FE615F|nr:methyltransferase domain-containing protein [Streptomyces sp. AV19]MBH1936604.1 methyltransferase domain-containing protein [Streptomyces sp. AV19]MDG4532664.1 methyltransferase domain-containing protein [Streptomyces sp. AV19]